MPKRQKMNQVLPYSAESLAVAEANARAFAESGAGAVSAMRLDFGEGDDRIGMLKVSGASGVALAANPSDRSKAYFDAAKSEVGYDKDAYRSLVTLCRNVVKDEGIIARYFDLLIALSSRGTENHFKDTVGDRYKTVYNQFAARVNEGFLYKTKGLDEFQRKFCRYWWETGLVVTIERTGPMKMGTGARNETFQVPLEIDFIEPTKIDLGKLYEENRIYYDLSDDEINGIKAQGLAHPLLRPYDDKVRKIPKSKDNPNPVQPLSKADVLSLVVDQKQTQIPLPDGKVRMVRNTFDDNARYPVPYLSSVLIPLADKAMLRESDRSVMSKLINMIVQYKIGMYNAAGQPTNVGANILKAASANFKQTISVSKDGRVMVLFLPDTHDISFAVPDTEYLLHESKYRTANLEVMAALSGPGAWQMMSQSGDLSLFMQFVWAQHEMFLNVYKRFVEEIYDSITVLNKLKFDLSDVNLKAKKLTIFDTKEFRAFVLDLAKLGWVSIESALDQADYDIDTEEQRMIREKQVRDEKGIFVSLQTFTQGVVKDGEKETKASPSGPGRPDGATDETPRDAPKEEKA